MVRSEEETHSSGKTLPSLISLLVSVDVKHHVCLLCGKTCFHTFTSIGRTLLDPGSGKGGGGEWEGGGEGGERTWSAQVTYRTQK